MTTFIPVFCYSVVTVRFIGLLLLILSSFCFPRSSQAQANASGVALEISLDREYHLADSEQGIYVLSQISAHSIKAADQPKLPLNLCLIIDRSGSMAGEPMNEAKFAISRAVETLDQNDTFSLITYGSEVETLIPAQQVKDLSNLEPRIQSIEAIGGSALYDALNQGAAQLRRHRTPTSVNRMLVLSDGPPTKGPREIDDFIALANLFTSEGLSVSTIGLGEDFNEDLLSSLATKGNGNFHYAQKNQDLSDTIISDLAPLNSIVARDVELKLEFNNVLKVEKVLGHGSEDNNQSVTFKWPQLYSGTQLKGLVSASLHPGIHSKFLNVKIVDATLSYFPASSGFSERISEKQTTKTKLTTSRRLATDSLLPETLREAFSLEIADSIKEAIELSDSGKLQKGLREIRSTLQDIKWVNYELKDEVIAQQIETLQNLFDRIKEDGMNQIDRKILTESVVNQPISTTSQNLAPTLATEND
ncbi:VWA domain-containing protein [Puniceicoccaceae bacterium K14]|nr:VWA domain-containing protein [Puniceicoccaceae bacterium K14]